MNSKKIQKIKWAALFHIYQPDHWEPRIIRKVATEAYRPLIALLKKRKSHKITLNIAASLTEQLYQYRLRDIIDGIRGLAEAGQIELTQTAKYHPILPLLPEAEVMRQLEINHATNVKMFGTIFQPKGVFLPEMCYSRQVGRVLSRLGYSWIILDEIALHTRRKPIDYGKQYWDKEAGISIMIRNRSLSDIFFNERLIKPQDFIRVIAKSLPAEQPLITALDGENLGHHRKGMDGVYHEMITAGVFETLTLSELFPLLPRCEVKRLTACSWASQAFELRKKIPYALWKDPENPIHTLQWRLVRRIMLVFNDAQQKKRLNSRLRLMLDQALNSDQFWWASAQPWWSVEVIEAALREWSGFLRLLAPVLTRRELKELEQLITEILRQAQSWQAAGVPEQRKQKYLQRIADKKYLGGELIH